MSEWWYFDVCRCRPSFLFFYPGAPFCSQGSIAFQLLFGNNIVKVQVRASPSGNIKMVHYYSL
jgi:hypothetical protein